MFLASFSHFYTNLQPNPKGTAGKNWRILYKEMGRLSSGAWPHKPIYAIF